MNMQLMNLLILSGAIGLAGCENQQEAIASVDKKVTAPQAQTAPIERWYSSTQVDRGNPLFQANCASCHKPDASGTPNWKETNPDGKYPPPPLNGTAHAWHHPLAMLRRSIRVGGVPLGGSMPGFGDKLNGTQIDDILAWVQSHWSDEIYRIWQDRDEQSKNKSL